MSRTIYKFHLDSKRNEISMPVGAKVLTVGSQTIADSIAESIVIWADVNLKAETEQRTFLVYGTGWPLPEDAPDIHYIGTALLYKNRLVFHVYEERNG